MKFYPYEKEGGGAKKLLAMLKGGGGQGGSDKKFGVVYTHIHTEGEGAQMIPPF